MLPKQNLKFFKHFQKTFLATFFARSYWILEAHTQITCVGTSKIPPSEKSVSAHKKIAGVLYWNTLSIHESPYIIWAYIPYISLNLRYLSKNPINKNAFQ